MYISSILKIKEILKPSTNEEEEAKQKGGKEGKNIQLMSTLAWWQGEVRKGQERKGKQSKAKEGK